jgi:hypothetical protein
MVSNPGWNILNQSEWEASEVLNSLKTWADLNKMDA